MESVDGPLSIFIDDTIKRTLVHGTNLVEGETARKTSDTANHCCHINVDVYEVAS